jgi:hypothetical protein
MVQSKLAAVSLAASKRSSRKDASANTDSTADAIAGATAVIWGLYFYLPRRSTP